VFSASRNVPLFHELADTLGIGAVTIKGDALDDEGGVDEQGNRFGIRILRDS
jgi:hypothetical protein